MIRVNARGGGGIARGAVFEKRVLEDGGDAARGEVHGELLAASF